MADLLKDMFNRESLLEIALSIQKVHNPFLVEQFLDTVMDETWPNLELKARSRKITLGLSEYLPTNFSEALSILEQALVGFSIAFFFPDFVEVYGQDEENWDLSINALARNTVYWSSEFAVRTFIINDEKRMMARMYEWSKDENEHLRRLASEGCRPQLPWGQSLPKYKNDPTPILPILEQLKTDSSLYVRKSVANNLNDISKTNPDLVVEIAKAWYGVNKDTNWIVKHGCRTLLKKGNHEVLVLLGYDDVTSIEASNFTLKTAVVSIGENITFTFTIMAKEKMKVRLEYGIDYVKANGQRNRKIFQISSSVFNRNEKRNYSRNHSFADLSTRKHYPGTHSVELIVNGVKQGSLDFELV